MRDSANTRNDTAAGIGRATGLMAVGTAISRITGVARIFAITYAIGSLRLADSYNLANTVPNIVHDLVLGGIVSATFIPVFVERLSTRPDDEAWEAISAVTTVTILVIGAATAVFFVLTPLIIGATTAFNHSPTAGQTRHVATDLLLLFVPQLTCYGFISLATALLNARRRFGSPMFTPIANNVVLIVVLVIFAVVVKHHPSIGGVAGDRGELLLLGLGTTLGVVIQAGLMIPSLRRAGLRLRWRPDFHHESVRTILKLSGWTFGLVVANQLALLVVLAMSEKVGTGAVSAYTYSYTFFQLPYGVVAVSIMAATAPELTTRWSVGDTEGFRRRMALGLRSMTAVVVPSAAGLLVLARPLVALIQAHGSTTVAQTVPTASALAMLALGLPGFCVFLYAIRVLQSIQDLRSAFWLYVLENAVNIVLAVALAGPLGVRGIALSISIAYTVAAAAALFRLRERVHGLGARWMARPLGRVLASSAVLVVATALASNVSASQRGLGLLVRVVLGVVAGGAAYFLSAGLLAAISARRRPSGPGWGGPPPHRDSDGPPWTGGSGSGTGSASGPGSEEPGGELHPGAARTETDGGPSRRRGAHVRAGKARQLTLRWRRRPPSPAPVPPEPLPPAGRPPLRPRGLGPTRRRGTGGSVHGRLDR